MLISGTLVLRHLANAVQLANVIGDNNGTLLLRGLDDFLNDVRETMKDGGGNERQSLLSDIEQQSDDD